MSLVRLGENRSRCWEAKKERIRKRVSDGMLEKKYMSLCAYVFGSQTETKENM